MSELIYVAAVGTDGMRPVVWGMGSGPTRDMAASEALSEARHQLREAGCSSDLDTVRISPADRERIDGGDVSADDLEEYEPTEIDICPVAVTL